MSLERSRSDHTTQEAKRLVCRAKADGTLTFVNDAYGEAMGLPLDQILGRTFWTFIPVSEHARVRRYLESLTPPNPVGTIEHAVRSETGVTWTERWVDFARFNEHGLVSEWFSVGERVAPNIEAAGEFRFLEPAVAWGVIASSIAHELNQPLMSIGANAEAAVRLLDRERPDLDEVREALREIRDENRRAATLIRHLVGGLRDEGLVQGPRHEGNHASQSKGGAPLR